MKKLYSVGAFETIQTSFERSTINTYLHSNYIYGIDAVVEFLDNTAFVYIKAGSSYEKYEKLDEGQREYAIYLAFRQACWKRYPLGQTYLDCFLRGYNLKEENASMSYMQLHKYLLSNCDEITFTFNKFESATYSELKSVTVPAKMISASNFVVKERVALDTCRATAHCKNGNHIHTSISINPLLLQESLENRRSGLYLVTGGELRLFVLNEEGTYDYKLMNNYSENVYDTGSLKRWINNNVYKGDRYSLVPVQISNNFDFKDKKKIGLRAYNMN